MLTASLVLSIAAPAAAAQSLPRPTGWVLDQPDLIPAGQQSRIEASLQDYHDRTRGEVAVALVRTLGDTSVENYATDLFREWRIGDKDEDSGVLLVIALDERVTRIETGYGAEAELTDIEARQILDTQVRPRMRAGDYAGAVDAGQRAIRAALGDTAAAAPAPAGRSQRPPTRRSSGGGLGLVFFLLPLIFMLMSAGGAGRRRRRRGMLGGGYGFPIFIGGGGFGGGGYGGYGGGGYGGGGFGGGSGFGGGGGGSGFGGFGGGESGGGGASSDW